MGNCGVGFAPVRPADHERLIELMEGVEDIPGAALHEGLRVDWESFPEYLDDLGARPRDLDLGAQVPHGALRLHVMGERGANREPATPDDIAAMAELAREAVAAGALGFTTSRTLNHRSSRGELTPTLTAEADELSASPRRWARSARACCRSVSDFGDLDHEFELLRTMAERSGRPISISVAQSPLRPDTWRTLLDRMADATRRRGHDAWPGRAPGPSACCSASRRRSTRSCWRRLGRAARPARSAERVAAAAPRRRCAERSLDHMTVDARPARSSAAG